MEIIQQSQSFLYTPCNLSSRYPCPRQTIPVINPLPRLVFPIAHPRICLVGGQIGKTQPWLSHPQLLKNNLHRILGIKCHRTISTVTSSLSQGFLRTLNLLSIRLAQSHQRILTQTMSTTQQHGWILLRTLFLTHRTRENRMKMILLWQRDFNG